jgi:hypothetical protein
MLDYENVLIGFLMLILLTLVVMIFGGLLISLNLNSECQKLGYDEYSHSSSNPICVKNYDINKETGIYNKCYMPLTEKLTEKEWCRK